MILPECACPDQVSLPDGYEMTWAGDTDFKGLGVIWKSTVKYHERNHEEFGKETSCTYHHQFKDDMPFFIDFTFTNIPLFAYMVGGWERNMSDHNPQIIVI